MGEACGQLHAGRFLVNGFPPRSASLTTVESGAGLLQFHQEPAMQAANPSVSAGGPIFDLTLLVQGIKNKSLSDDEARALSMNLCVAAKSILLLAIDQADSKSPFRLSSKSELMDALYASASLIEFAEFAVTETENCL